MTGRQLYESSPLGMAQRKPWEQLSAEAQEWWEELAQKIEERT